MLEVVRKANLMTMAEAMPKTMLQAMRKPLLSRIGGDLRPEEAIPNAALRGSHSSSKVPLGVPEKLAWRYRPRVLLERGRTP